MPTVLITGTNSGIGLEFARQYAAAGWRVFAAYFPAGNIDDLRQLAAHNGQVTLIPLDITHEKEVLNAAHKLAGEAIDVLINNAGINVNEKDQELQTVSIDTMQRLFLTNALGPLLVTRAFLDHVTDSKLKTIATVSTIMSSIALNKDDGSYAYRTSAPAC